MRGEGHGANRLSEAVLRALVVAVRHGDVHAVSRLTQSVDTSLLSLDESAGKELTRARRYERPLAVICVMLRSTPRELSCISTALREELRLSDIVGLANASMVVAVLPETSGPGACEFLGRLANRIGEELSNLTEVGVASFPDDDVTWLGLKTAAYDRRGPLTAFRGQLGKERAGLIGDGASVRDRAPGSALKGSSPAASPVHDLTAS